MPFVIEVFAPECVVCKYYIIGTWRVPGFSVISKIVLSLCVYTSPTSLPPLSLLYLLSPSPLPPSVIPPLLFPLSFLLSLFLCSPPLPPFPLPFPPILLSLLLPPSLSFLRTSSTSLSPLPRLPLSPFLHPSVKYTNIIMINLNLK